MHRYNKRLALLRGLKNITNPTARGVLPAFRENFQKGSRTAVLVPGDALDEVIEKWIRGIHYCELGIRIPANYKVSIQFVDDNVADEAFGEILRYATRIQKGPGIEVLYWHVEENGESITQYAFCIWERFRACGSVESPGFLQ